MPNTQANSKILNSNQKSLSQNVTACDRRILRINSWNFTKSTACSAEVWGQGHDYHSQYRHEERWKACRTMRHAVTHPRSHQLTSYTAMELGSFWGQYRVWHEGNYKLWTLSFVPGLEAEQLAWKSICGQREMGIVIILQAAHTGVSDMECTILLIVITQTRIALQQGKEDSAWYIYK